MVSEVGRLSCAQFIMLEQKRSGRRFELNHRNVVGEFIVIAAEIVNGRLHSVFIIVQTARKMTNRVSLTCIFFVSKYVNKMELMRHSCDPYALSNSDKFLSAVKLQFTT